VLRVYGPSVCTYLGAVTSGFFRLYHTGVAFPTNRLKVAHIVEQVKVAFVGLNVVDDG
jgi:hypothetical protein